MSSRSILSSSIVRSLLIRRQATSLSSLQATRQPLAVRPGFAAVVSFHTPASRNANRNENKPALSNLDFLDPPSSSKRHGNTQGGSNKQGSSIKKAVGLRPPAGNNNINKQGSKVGGDPFDVLEGSTRPARSQYQQRKDAKSTPSQQFKTPAGAAVGVEPATFTPKIAPLDRPPRDEEIQAQWIQFINDQGQNEGERRLSSVLRSIDRKKFFLVQVDTHANPPICKLFSKSELFQKAKKEKQAKKANEMVTKELQLTWGTAEHDLSHKLNKYKGFLVKGYRVDIQITGRKGKTSTKQDRETMLEKIKAELEPESKYVRPIAWTNEVTANMLLQGNKQQ